MQSSKVVIPVGSERYIGSSQRVLNLQESVRMVVAVSMHFRAGCFSTCRVGMGHRSGLVGEGVAHIHDHDGHHPVRNLTDLDHPGRTVCACGKRRRSKGSRPEPVLLY